MKITILTSSPKHPVVKGLNDWIKIMSAKGHSTSLVFNKADLSGGDILFLVSCGYIVQDKDRKKYTATLVLHASDLPIGRGWSPHIWSILKGETRIVVSLLEASDSIDEGKIWLKTSFDLSGNELAEEINARLFETEFSLMSQAIEQFHEIRPMNQIGDAGDYFRKRMPEDSRIDPYKSISDQFNLLRIADPDRYPAFFEYRGVKYLIKIEKANSD